MTYHDYSQSQEQDIIVDYFGGEFTGTLLDIGANDGITLSNSYFLIQQGWKGTLVEPSPIAYERLVNTHTSNFDSLQFIDCAIGSYDGKVILHESGELLGTGDVGLVSSIVDAETKRWKPMVKFTDVEVEVKTFKTILHLSRYKTFDFITFDIEGMDLEVLPQMNLRELKTKLICVEFNGIDQKKYEAIILSQGFKLIHQTAENLIYGI